MIVDGISNSSHTYCGLDTQTEVGVCNKLTK